MTRGWRFKRFNARPSFHPRLYSPEEYRERFHGRLHGSIGFTGGNFGEEEEEPVEEEPVEEETQVQDQVPVEDAVAPDPNAVQFGPETNPNQLFPVVLQEEQDAEAWNQNLTNWFKLLYGRVHQIFLREKHKLEDEQLTYRLRRIQQILELCDAGKVNPNLVGDVRRYYQEMRTIYQEAKPGSNEGMSGGGRYPLISADCEIAGINRSLSIDSKFSYQIMTQGIDFVFETHPYFLKICFISGRVTPDFFFTLSIWANQQQDCPCLYTPLDIACIFYTFYSNKETRNELLRKYKIKIWLPSDFYKFGYTYKLYGHVDLPELKQLFLYLRKKIERYFFLENKWYIKDPRTKRNITHRIKTLVYKITAAKKHQQDVSALEKYYKFYRELLRKLNNNPSLANEVIPVSNPELKDSRPEEIEWNDRLILEIYEMINPTEYNDPNGVFYGNALLVYWGIANALKFHPYSMYPYNAVDIATLIHLYYFKVFYNLMSTISWWHPFDVFDNEFYQKMN